MRLTEVLLKKELNEILAALPVDKLGSNSIADNKTQKIKKYDFRSANRFPKDQMKTLHLIYSNFSSLLSTFMTGILGTDCTVSVESVEERTYHEFANDLPSPVILGIIEMMPLEGSTVLEISPSLVYAIISRLLGGSGAPSNMDRNFTEIDLVIMEKIIRQIIPLINEAWSKIITINASLDRIETGSQFAQVVSSNETIAIITCMVEIDNTTGFLKICIPHIAIEPIGKQLNTKYASSWFDSKRKSESNSENILSRLSFSHLDICAVLSETNVLVNDIANLQVGDVIQLDNKANGLVAIKIEDILKMYGLLGVKDKKYSVRITELINEEEA